LPDIPEIESGWILEPGGESPFKRIEWVEITNVAIPYRWEKVPQKHRPQDVEAAIALLNEAGQFELERTEISVRAYGYR
jgi:hypothetical protein